MNLSRVLAGALLCFDLSVLHVLKSFTLSQVFDVLIRCNFKYSGGEKIICRPFKT